MKYIFAGILFVIASFPVAAQDAQSRFNARIGAQIGDLVIQNDNLAVLVDTLQSQLASAQQRIKDLEAKLVDAQKPSEEGQK